MLLTLALMAAVAALTAAYMMVSFKRVLPRLEPGIEQLPPLTQAINQYAGLTGGSVHEANEVTVYQNGELLEALKTSIRSARRSIHLESYVWNKGKTEEEFVSLLSAKAKEGVTVRLVVDSVGAMGASKNQMDKLQTHGVLVGFYHSAGNLNLRRFNNRSHRKLLIVDGETGFTFGHGVQDEWRGQAQDPYHWRDTGVRVRGSMVYSLQVLFAQDWIDATGAPPLDEGCFRKADQPGSVTGHLVSSSTRGGHSSVALLYMLAIASAREEIIIQNPYFAPGPTLTNLITMAARRGVTVHLMLPGKYSDSPLLRRAGQRLYRELLEAGVRIYLYDRTFAHQKIVVVDRNWSHIGSTNFDARSLVLNAEVGIGFLDRDIAEQLISAFEKDLEDSREPTLEEWNGRPRREKVLDWCAYQLYSQI